MKKLLILLPLALLLTQCSTLNQQATSHEGEPILLGKINRAGLEKLPYGEWFNNGYQGYTVDQSALGKSSLDGIEILTFMGTWCSDSREYVPHFYKILDDLNFNKKRHAIVALDNHPDRNKTSPGGEEKGWNIEYVPTFIFLKNGREIGRIVESPMESLEQDMAGILRQN